jgi:hypothetical protein
MPKTFYQANFCAECGNPLEPRQGWRPRYFCDHCSAQIGRRGFMTPLSLAIGLLVVIFLSSDRPQSNRLDRAGMMTAPAVTSAQDATAKQKLNPQPNTEERVLCGARTKKGTPCRRMVRPGQLCYQHRRKG